MASCGNQQFCTLCLEDDICNEAVTWCIDCETFLCSTCERHHKRNKSSKDHRIVSVEEYENLPALILNTTNRCVEHDKRYELYCRFHESACCIQCINDHHKECRDLPLLSDILGNIKSSAAMFHLEKDLIGLKECFDDIMQIVSNKILTIDKQKEKTFSEIRGIRRRINDHLDKLENQLIEKLSAANTRLKSDTEKLMLQLHERRNRIDRLHADFIKMKEFATDLQTFLGSKAMEEMKREELKYMERFRSSRELYIEYYGAKISSAIQSFVSDVKAFGEISVNLNPASSQLKAGSKEICEQIPIVQVTNIFQIKPKLKKAIRIPERMKINITGCQMLPGGQILFADNNNKCLMLFSADGEYIRNVVTFDSKPWDVCYVNDNTVAVTLVNASKVKIVDVKMNKIEKSFDTNEKCYGVDYDQRSIIITTLYGILSIDLDNGQISKMITLDGLSPSCVTCFQNKIYVAYFLTGGVVCYQRNGDLLWTYKYEDITSPRSLSVDRYGFLYMSCRETHNIVVLTPDGKEERVILSEKDGLNHPFALNIDKRACKLLVGDFDDSRAFLFQI